MSVDPVDPQLDGARIRVLDRARLEQMACECYEVVKREFARLLPWESEMASTSAKLASNARNP